MDVRAAVALQAGKPLEVMAVQLEGPRAGEVPVEVKATGAAATYRADLRSLDELTTRELYDLLRMRVDVFVVEQNCPYPELDGKDIDALHLRLLEGAELLGAARILKPYEPQDPSKIGRVVVSPDHRGKRLGDALMSEAIAACERLYPENPIALSAQAHLRRFYESFGFIAVSQEYLEDGIPHIDMVRQQATQPA
ncbi:GNAT family N-acetyltransferase [Rhizobium leguminosarum]|jgi:ElaA protein|uniref:GCN5-related N-acetyltransferase n=1 Tax=Rhizobium leguminosarum bv. trifolii (strain WSM1325) TaxID=395491 RepID=C6AYQ4_RHILS|nr:GNAT family N-acetyltransferase [Rhizobium leguminosarum]ACS56356.1 GCN5-related N-acetyltransferase [Rhizobium leguminosarum bv. trifolii WSM1325]RWX34748.1 GNAT family N-acetyltransferase [Rhizobium leguminosarum]RWY70257.1 GNAT family N-acetyltransferase [Rhizobium leguminosarum]